MSSAGIPVVIGPPASERHSASRYHYDPLGPFVRGKAAPYVFRMPGGADAVVLPVRHKTDLVTTKFGRVHRNVGTAAVMEDGRMRFAARWACGSGSPNAVLVADAREFGVCIVCEDKIDPQPCVYRFYDAEGDLLYIGSTNQRRQRFRTHERTSPWWGRVADVKVEDFPAILDARIAEAKAIYAEDPPCNHHGRPS